MNRHTHRLTCLLIAAALLPGLAGCRNRARKPNQSATPAAGLADPAPGNYRNAGQPPSPAPVATAPAAVDNSQIAAALNRQATLASIRGRGVIRMFDTPSRFRLGVNADLVGSRAENFLRIKAEKLAGAVNAFELYMDRNDVALYVPMEKTLFVGTIADCENMGLPINPDEILDQLLRPDTELLTFSWTPVGGDRNFALYQNEGRQLQVAIDRRTGLIAYIEQFDRAGQVFMRKTMENFRAVDLFSGGLGGRAANDPNQKVYPLSQKIEWPGRGRRVEINFKRLQPNNAVTDADFDFGVPPNTREQPLNRAQIESDGE